jgi:hypothetical protein
MTETDKIMESGANEQWIQQNSKYAEMYSLHINKYRWPAEKTRNLSV